MPRWVESAPKVMRWGYVETTATVRWGECDGQGHAYYGSYIPWFDLGREAFALAVGVDFWNYTITTTEFHVRYHTPAKYLDELVIKTWATTPTARLDCYYEIYRRPGSQLIAEGRSGHALVDPRAGGLRMRAPDSFHDKFEEFLDIQQAKGGTPGRGLPFAAAQAGPRGSR
ncbi:acyl-CoA thioesterase [Micromonospora sp. DT31]